MSLTTHEEISRRSVLRSPPRRGTVRTSIPVEAMSPEAIFPERSRLPLPPGVGARREPRPLAAISVAARPSEASHLPLLPGVGARREPMPPAAISVAARPSEASHWPLLPGAGARREPMPPAAISVAARPSEASHWPLLPGAGARREPMPPAAIPIAARLSEASLHEEIPFHTVPRPPIPSELSLKGTDKEFVRNLEIFVRGRMPAAFNQLEDLYRDPQTLYRWKRTKGGIQYLIDKGHTIGKNISEIRSGRVSSSMQDVAMLGRAALTFGGGACNDYSAASALAYMGSGAMDPITRFWAPGMGHSFDVVGDIRTPKARVLDSWVTERNPHGYLETQLPSENPIVINKWAPRVRGEGEQLYRDYMRDVNERAFYHSADSVSQSAFEVEQQRLLAAYERSSDDEKEEFHLYFHPNHDCGTEA